MRVVDIAFWQRGIDINAVVRDGAEGIILKAGGVNGGSPYVDSQYRNFAPSVRATGKGLGHYFFNGPVDAGTSARHFIANLSNYQSGDVLALDIESEPPMPAQSPEWAYDFLSIVKSWDSNANLFLYTYQSTFNGSTNSRWARVRDLGARLWIAAPGSSPDRINNGPWGEWTIWQKGYGVYGGKLIDDNDARGDTWRDGNQPKPSNSSSVNSTLLLLNDAVS